MTHLFDKERTAQVNKGYLPIDDDFNPSVDLENSTVDAYTSTPYQDRDGEIVLPGAFDQDIDTYIANPILLLSHNHKSLPVGKCIHYETDQRGLRQRFKISSTDTGREVLTLFSEGILRAFSPGFVPIDFVDNPPSAIIPKEFLKTSKGKRTKRIYKRVELIEVSALAIPSNRDALVIQVEKGNRVADLVVKMYEPSTPPGVLEQLFQEIEEYETRKKTFYCFVEKGAGFNFLIQNRDQFGSSFGGQDPDFNSMSDHEKMLLNQMMTQQSIDDLRKRMESGEFSGRETWVDWAKKWGGIAAAGVLANAFLRRTNTGQALTNAAKNHVKDWINSKLGGATKIGIFFRKGMDEEGIDEAKEMTSSLDVMIDFLKKGRELGLDNTPEYEVLSNKISILTDELKNLAAEDDNLVKGFPSFISKEMSPEEFEESEHPRASDGKFTDKPGEQASRLRETKVVVLTSPPVRPREVIQDISDHAIRHRIQTAKHFEGEPQSYKDKVFDWVSKNKGKSMAIVGASLVAAPLAFVTAKVGGRTLKMVYSSKGRRLIPWEKVTPEQRKKFFSSIEPGDIWLWGGKQPTSLTEVGKDLLFMRKHQPVYDKAFSKRVGEFWKAKEGALKRDVEKRLAEGKEANFEEEFAAMKSNDTNKMGALTAGDRAGREALVQQVGDEQAGLYFRARDRVIDIPSKIIAGSEYPHSNIVIAKFDRNYLDKLEKSLVTPEGNKVVRTMFQESDLPGIEESLRKRILKEAKENKSFSEDLKKELLKELEGYPILVKALPKGEEGRLRPVIMRGPNWYVDEGHVAVVKTKLNGEQRQALYEGLNEDVLNRREGEYVLAMAGGPDLKKDIDLLGSSLGDPLVSLVSKRSSSGKFKFKSGREGEEVLCTGLAAALLKKYGKLGSETSGVRHIGVNDILNDKKIADAIVEPGLGLQKIEHQMSTGKAVALGAGAGAGTIAVGHVARNELQKGFSSFIAKQMTAEEFEESEHPRASDGKFTDKPGGTAAPKTQKPPVAHGGYRTGAGRLPKKASLAVETKMERYRQENPNLSDSQLRDKVRADAVRLGKPDWVSYLDNPVEHMKREQQEMIDAARSKYNAAKVRKQTIRIGDVHTGDIVSSSMESKARFDRDVAKASTLKEAWQVYRDENSERDEVNNAKTVLAVGAIASLFAFSALMLARPNLRRQGLIGVKRRYANLIKDVEGNELLMRDINVPEGDYFKVLDPTWLRLEKVTGGATETGLTPGSIKRWLGRALAKLEKRESPEEYAAVGLGAKWYGLKNLFAPQKTYAVNLRKEFPDGSLKNIENYVVRAKDRDLRTGAQFIDDSGNIDWEVLLNNKSIFDGKLTRRVRVEGTSGEFKDEVINFTDSFEPKLGVISRRKKAGQRIPTSESEDIKAGLLPGEGAISPIYEQDGKYFLTEEMRGNHALLEDWALAVGLAKRNVRGKVVPRDELLPEFLAREYPTKVMDDLLKKADGYGGWVSYVDMLLGSTSRKILSGLAATGAIGGGAAYYFHQDIASFADAVKAERDRRTKLEKSLAVQYRASQDPELLKLRAQTAFSKQEAERYKRGARYHESAAGEWDRRALLVQMLDDRNVSRARVPGTAKPATIIEQLGKDPRLLGMSQKEIYEVMTGKRDIGGWFAKERKAGRGYDENQRGGLMAAIEEAREPFISAMEKFEAEAKSFDAEFIIKALQGEDKEKKETEPILEDLISDALAEDIIEQITDISKACQTTIEGGIPGHSRFESTLEMLNGFYVNLKEAVEGSSTEKVAKGFFFFIEKAAPQMMSASVDRDGGLFTPETVGLDYIRWCPRCLRYVTEELIGKCNNPDCPFSFRESIVGDAKPPDIKEKETKEEVTKVGQEQK